MASHSHQERCARLNIMRLGASRLNFYESVITGTVNGVNQGTGPGKGLRIEGASIDQILNDQVDTARFRASGFTPVAGQTITVYDGDTTPDKQLFGGRIIETTRLYEGKNINEAFDLHCVDPTWLMGRRLVLVSYRNVYAFDIIVSLAIDYTRGLQLYDWRYITIPQTNDYVIDEITFTNESVPICFTAIAERIGANWYVDYQGYLHFFLTESPDANAITDASPHGASDLQLSEDLSQVVTKIIGRGGGVGAAIDVPAASVEIPVEEGDTAQTWYAQTGGIVEIKTMIVQYSGVKGLGATGALVGTGNAPSAAPVPVPMAGSSHTIGATYGYATTYVTASGETQASPIGSITVSAFSPVTPPAVTARTRGGGTFPPGAITPGASQFTFLVQIVYRGGAVGPMGPQSALYTWDGNDWEVHIGARSNYTAPDGSAAWYYPLLEPGGPAAPTERVVVYRTDNAGGAGPMQVSSDSTYFSATGYVYQCAVSYTTGGTLLPSGYGAVNVTGIPVGTASGITGRKVYRTTANGSALKLLTTIANNTATSYGDTVADAALGIAPPSTDTSQIKDEGQVQIGATQLPVSATQPFQVDMTGGVNPGGWVRTGGMVLRYTGIGTGVLTGVPATGVGSITAVIRYGAQVLVQPRLVGIPPSGTGSLGTAIQKGDQVIIRLEKTDTAARDVMASRLQTPGQPVNAEDGIIELVVSDSRFTLTELQDHIDATLLDRKDPKLTLTFLSRDPSLQVGRLVTVNTTKPAITGTFRIQKISLSEIAVSGGLATVRPLKRVEASNKLYKFTDLLRRLRSMEGGVR